MLTNKEVLQQLLNKSPAKALKINETEEKYLYNLGAKKCQIGDYISAMPIFQLLVTINPSKALYLKALAACHQNKEEYLPAYSLYNYSYFLDQENNSDCLFYMGVCSIELGKLQQAQECLENTIRLGCNEHIIARTKLLLKHIQHTMDNSSGE